MRTTRRRRVCVQLAALGLLAASAGTATAEETAPDDAAPPYNSQVSETVHVPTRFGDRLTIELTFPAIDGERAPGPFPVVACLCYITNVDSMGAGSFAGPLRSPYAKAGYVAATVRVAGSGTSEGGPWNLADKKWQLMNYDAIEWLGTQPWSTGEVGTLGFSGNGMSQIFTSQHRPPHLETMIVGNSGHDSYYVLMPGGMPSLQIAAFGCAIPGALTHLTQGIPVPPLNSNGVPLSVDELGYLLEANVNKYTDDQFLPFCPITQGAWQHPTRDEYWTGALRSNVEDVSIPVWAWGGWDDIFDLTIPKFYSEVGSEHKMLTMGMNSHLSPGGSDGFDRIAESIRWFDYWLKGEQNGIGEELESDAFRYYVNREFVWKSAPEYPIPGTDYTPFYLSSGAAGPLGEGSLARTPPATAGSSGYTYVPLLSLGGQTEMTYDLLNPVDPNSAERDNIVGHNLTTGDQRLLAGPDTVTYISEPLTEDVEVTGPVTATLFASSTAADTDFVVKLIDVFPNDQDLQPAQPGFWNLVTTGNLKGTFRSYKGQYAQEWPIPVGEVVRYDIQAKPTSYLFEKGHRIAVTIQSSYAPRLMPNLNPAQVTIHHSPKYPSHITLPIIGEDAESTIYKPERRKPSSPVDVLDSYVGWLFGH